MIPLTELEAYRELMLFCLSININVNDTFAYATKDSEELTQQEIKFLIPFMQKYAGEAIIAYIAVKRRYDPKIVTPEFYDAKREIKKRRQCTQSREAAQNNMSKPKKSKTDWERVKNMKDEEIDYSDIPKTTLETITQTYSPRTFLIRDGQIECLYCPLETHTCNCSCHYWERVQGRLERLQKALKQYAGPGNWTEWVGDDENDVEWTCEIGPKIAQETLKNDF